jgi:L-asparaginase II
MSLLDEHSNILFAVQDLGIRASVENRALKCGAHLHIQTDLLITKNKRVSNMSTAEKPLKKRGT